MSYFDEDELECPFCGHIGVLPDGDFDFECPACGKSFPIDYIDMNKDN